VRGSIELKTDVIEEGKAELYINGLFQDDIDYSNQEEILLKVNLQYERHYPQIRSPHQKSRSAHRGSFG